MINWFNCNDCCSETVCLYNTILIPWSAIVSSWWVVILTLVEHRLEKLNALYHTSTVIIGNYLSTKENNLSAYGIERGCIKQWLKVFAGVFITEWIAKFHSNQTGCNKRLIVITKGVLSEFYYNYKFQIGTLQYQSFSILKLYVNNLIFYNLLSIIMLLLMCCWFFKICMFLCSFEVNKNRNILVIHIYVLFFVRLHIE